MQEKVFFKTTNGIELCGILAKPSEETSGEPVVILAHGFATGKDSFTSTQLAAVLGSVGISTFRFDFFGHGESDGDFADITLSQGTADIISAYGYLQSQGYGKIALAGSSFGGAAAILAAVKLPELFALALKCPVSDYEELEIARKGEEGLRKWKEEGHEEYESGDGRKLRLNYSFFEDLKSNNGLEVASEILAPVLIVHGDNDDEVPVSQSIRLSQELGDCVLEIIPGADHRFSREDDFKQMIQLISEFLVREVNNLQ